MPERKNFRPRKKNQNPKPKRDIRKSETDDSGLKQEIRLNKYIADAGICSRRKADELIADGVVKVDGKTVKEMGFRVNPGEEVTVNGDPVSYYTKKVYILLNKPKDCVTTTIDDKGRKTVLDIVKRKERIYPVGRLDRNTTGTLLLTNDGELSHRLSHPSYEVEKIYNVGLDKNLEFEHARKIADGVELEDGKTAPCFVFIDPSDKKKVTVTITEGRYREVRRMFEHFDYEVKKLDRKFFAGLSTRGLARSQYRFLSHEEITDLRRLVKMK